MTAKDPWEKEIAGVTPLKKKPAAVSPAPPAAKPRRRDRPRPEITFDPKASYHQDRFDPGLYEKIARGKVALDARVDLHDFTEDRAYRLLESRIDALFAAGKRRLLVITGKGKGGAGRIRTALPGWLSSPRFLPLVASLAEAAPRHGGAGACYVLLRRHGGAA